MTLRFLTTADAEAYWHLRLEMLEREPGAYGTSAEEHRATHAAEMVARFSGTASWTVGAFVGGSSGEHLRGAATLVRETRRKTRHRAAVVGVYVGSELRGQGLGRALVTALLDQARAVPGIERVAITVAATQDAARSLYRGLGFIEWGREPGALQVDGTQVDEHHLALVL